MSYESPFGDFFVLASEEPGGHLIEPKPLSAFDAFLHCHISSLADAAAGS
jgi:hypothetical protein